MTKAASRVGQPGNELAKIWIIFFILITFFFLSIGKGTTSAVPSQDWREPLDQVNTFSNELDVSFVERDAYSDGNVDGTVLDRDTSEDNDDEGTVLSEDDMGGLICGGLVFTFFVFFISYKLGKRKGYKNAMAEIKIREAQRGIVATPLSPIQTRETMAPKYGLACAQHGMVQPQQAQPQRSHQPPAHQQVPSKRSHQLPVQQQVPPKQSHQLPVQQKTPPSQRPTIEINDVNIPGTGPAMNMKYGVACSDQSGPSETQKNREGPPVMHFKYGLPCRNTIGIESYQELDSNASPIPGIVEPVLTVRYSVTCKQITEMNRSMDAMETTAPAQGPVMNMKYGIACHDLLGPGGIQGISGSVQTGAEPVMTVKYGYACNQLSQEAHNLDGKGNELNEQSRIPGIDQHLDGKGDNGILQKPSASAFPAGRVVCAHCNNAIILGEDIRDCPICHQLIR